MKPRIPALLSTLLVGLLVSLLSGCAYISRATETATGVQADAASGFASLSADGRWVAFRSLATNLVPGDTNGVYDVFVRDNLTKKVVRVSVADNGTQGNGRSEFPSISDDGRRVAFASEATNLRPGDTNGIRDIFIHDRDTDHDGIFDEPGATHTELFSYSSTGQGGNGPSDRPEINGDGNGVVFESAAALVPEDTNGVLDIYSMQVIGGLPPVPKLISKPVGVGQPANDFSEGATVNLDGSVVAFATAATNLLPGDTNGVTDVVIWDAHTSPPTLSRGTGGVQADQFNYRPDLSRDVDGRFVVFLSGATNLVPGPNSPVDVYVLDRSDGTVTAESRAPDGSAANNGSFDPSISADGTRVTYSSLATNLVDGDTNGEEDVFVRDRRSNLTQIASTASFLELSAGFSGRSDLSADGRYVAYDSTAPNLVTPDANGNAPDIFTHAAIVPVIYNVVRYGTVFPLGSFESAAHLNWGSSTLHVRGQGFAPDVTVDLGPNVAISNVTRTPTDIYFQADVTNGTAAGTRNLVVDNPPSAGLGGRGGTQVCFGCVAIQRWAALPDPVVNPSLIVVVSNSEFTPSTQGSGFGTAYWSPSLIWLVNGSFGTGDNDLTLDGTTSGTVTCSACIHVR